jgi:nicotianamine synthase
VDDQAAAGVLTDPGIRRLRPELLSICARGESMLEQVWARRVVHAVDPWSELYRFPYLDNYRQLTRLELHTVAGARCGRLPAGRICFLGGGALPVSALLMHRELGSVVDVVDNHPQAVELARQVLGRLAPGPGIRVVRAEAGSPEDMAQILADCELVFVAALVGCTRAQKQAVLRAVGQALKPGALLVVRSAHGLRSLLYPVVEPDDVTEAAGCTPQVLVHPLDDVVNSVLVARRP